MSALFLELARTTLFHSSSPPQIQIKNNLFDGGRILEGQLTPLTTILAAVLWLQVAKGPGSPASPPLLLLILLLFSSFRRFERTPGPPSSPAGIRRTGTGMFTYRPGLLLPQGSKIMKGYKIVECITKLWSSDMFYPERNNVRTKRTKE